MVVRSRRVAGPVAVTAAGVLVYDVPAGRTLVITGVTAVNAGAVAQGCNLYLNLVAAGNLLWAFGNIPSGGSASLGRFLTLNPGDVLRANCGAVGSVFLTVSGSLLLGEPT